MVRAEAPKKIWDDSLEYEAYVRSNTAHDIYTLQGEVPELVMSGETSDISQFVELEFYQWVMFRDDPIQFTGDNPVLGRYLGPALYAGTEMIAKIMKENGGVVHRSTYDSLPESEARNLAHISRRETFDKNISVKLGPDFSPDDFSEINLEDTSLYDFYEDDHYDSKGQLVGPKDEEPPTQAIGIDTEVLTPEADNNYVDTSIMLLIGSNFAHVRLIGRKSDVDGNPTGRAKENPILDTQEYQVELGYGEVSELTTNVIAESMYASCDDEVNKYLLMDSLVDYHNNNKVMSVSDKRSELRGRPVMIKSTAG